jgi:anti-sigma B factor antagonist
MVAQFELVVVSDDQMVVIACSGDLDLSTREQLERAIESSLDGGIVSVLRLDLHGLQFIDSTGLRELIRAQRDCDARGVRLELVTSPVVGRLLELTDALRHFTIVERPPT